MGRRISDNGYQMHSNLDTRDEKMHERMHKHKIDIEKLSKQIDFKTKEIAKKVDTEVQAIIKKHN